MAVAAKPAMPTGADALAPLSLEHEVGPAVVIDSEAAEILAVNATGGEALGLFPYATFPIALDPTTPAIARLRQIAAAGGIAKGNVETLLFWSSGRLKRVKCSVSKWGGKGSKVLLVHINGVEMPDDAGTPAPRKPPSTPRGHPGSKDSRPKERDATAPKPVAALDAEYLAKLAHELKTPLTAIAAASEIMRDERLGEMKNARYLSYAADIHESATHALDLIMSLLADRAKPAVSVSRLIALDLNAIVERTVSSMQALAQSCELTLSFETEGTRPHVVANPTALRQILLNLLTNAIKFTPRGGSVHVTTGHIDDGRVFLIVRDTGCGMTRSGVAAGSPALLGDRQPAWAHSNGIGLPLVETLVRDMGAEIEIESAPLQGTSATIVFADFTRRFT